MECQFLFAFALAHHLPRFMGLLFIRLLAHEVEESEVAAHFFRLPFFAVFPLAGEGLGMVAVFALPFGDTFWAVTRNAPLTHLASPRLIFSCASSHVRALT